MTNLDKFHSYLARVPSPEHFITWDYYFMVASVLGRKVWHNPLDFFPVFPNMYLVFVAGPGVGKSLPANFVREVLDGLRVSPYKDGQEKLQETDKLLGTERTKSPVTLAPDDCSVERLINLMSTNTSSFFYTPPGGDKPVEVAHSSMCACVSEELATLFREKQNVLVQWLNGAYNCGTFKRETEKHKKQVIKNMCLNLLGCAVPKWIAKNINEDLLDTGFAARTLFIWGEKARFKIGILRPDDSKKHLMGEITEHLKKLAQLTGQVVWTKEAEDWYEDWCINKSHIHLNPNRRLASYYERKRIHLLKVAMNVHFGYSTEMTLELSDFKQALKLLNQLEIDMHLALADVEKQPIHKVRDIILELLAEKKDVTVKTIRLHCFDYGGKNPDEVITGALDHLLSIDAITNSSVDGKNYHYNLTKREEA